MKSSLLVLFLLATTRLCATHIVGGEITYRCLGDSTYEVTLTVYRDCYNGVPWFDPIGYIGVYDTAWNLVTSLKPTHIEGVSQVDTLDILLTNPCLIVPPNVCVNWYSYRATVKLPYRPGGYVLVYQRCCRNQLIRNLLKDPEDVGASYTAYLSEFTLQNCNSSPLFRSWPPPAICIHQPIDYDHGADDIDGDSLVYRLCDPLDGATPDVPMPQPPNPGPYIEVDWQTPPYSLGNLLGGEPLTIDPKTGFMTGIPNTIGNFVVGVCLDEYRGDSLINTARRDFQFNVADCGAPVAAFFTPKVLCNTLTATFENQSVGEKTNNWYFDWENDKSLTSNASSPTYTYPDTGYYTVALIVNEAETCRDTFFTTIHLTKSLANAALDIQLPACDSIGLTVQANDLSTDPVNGIVAWQWQLTGNAYFNSSTQQNPKFTVVEPGKYFLRLITTSGNGCMDTVLQQLNAPIPMVDALPRVLNICQGDTIPLFNGASTGFVYAWSPSTALSNPTLPNPLAFPDTTTTYQAVISGNGPCVRKQTVVVNVLELGSLVAMATPDTIFLGESSQLNVESGGFPVVWQPAATLSNPSIFDPVATPQATTNYVVKTLGTCTLTAEVQVVVILPFCAEPYIFFPTGFSPNGDGENDALQLEGNFIEEAYWMIYNRWGEKVFEANSVSDAWDGNFRGQPQPAETYGYYLRVRCVGGEVLVKKGNVTLLR